jgi:predicted  nucleic acid-binding Zn-ribbon protein
MIDLHLFNLYDISVVLCKQVELREQLSAKETSHQEELAKIRSEHETSSQKLEEGSSAFKEQIRQHSVTICALEERLNKVVKKNKDYQAETTELKKTINGCIYSLY